MASPWWALRNERQTSFRDRTPFIGRGSEKRLLLEELRRGTALDPYVLFDAGWPGVQLHPEPAVSRVYLSIWKLRNSGVAEVLLHQTDGYLLDPEVPALRQA